MDRGIWQAIVHMVLLGSQNRKKKSRMMGLCVPKAPLTSGPQ